MQKNVVFLVFDTLRKDSLYPYNLNLETPAINKLVQESIIFPSAISPASWTLPVHGSFFTGKYPSKSGIREDLNDLSDFSYLIDSYNGRTLSEIFLRGGYNTYSFSQNGLIGEDTGYSRGFQINKYTKNEFQERNTRLLYNFNKISTKWGSEPLSILKSIVNNKNPIDFGKTYVELKKDTNWFKKNDMTDKGGQLTIENIERQNLQEPFFLFINLMEMHDPHDYASLKMSWQDSVFGKTDQLSKFRSKIYQSYLKTALVLDKIISKLISVLKRLQFLENTLIILTSDHGQSLFEERNYYGHGNFLLDKIIEVPLILRLPNSKKFSINKGYQSTCGLYETIPQIAIEDVNFDNITSEICFSEVYGSMDKKISKYSNTKNFQQKFNKLNTVKKAVYKDGYKLVLDLTNGKIEELKKNGENASLELEKTKVNELVDEINTFSWNENLVYPNI
jgi:arylsulfatase A-like enzyme